MDDIAIRVGIPRSVQHGHLARRQPAHCRTVPPARRRGFPSSFAGILLGMVLGLLSARAQTPPETIALLDFTAPAESRSQWAWAEGGLADCLQIELEQLGWTMLDRDLIHAVLAEQRLTGANLTADGRLKIGSLLHARYLVAGRLTPLAANRVRVEATAFSVESVETAAAAASEGELPKELSEVVKALAKQLAGKLSSPASMTVPLERRAPAPKPESLILFYRGLNACAQGRPELAVPWFMNAASLDDQFTAPLLWEVRAYEMAGFDRFAAIRREEVASILKQQGFDMADPSANTNRAEFPVLAVLNPVMDLPAGANSATTTAALESSLKQGLIDAGRVRLFAYEGLGQAMAEQDLKLSSYFARQYAPRYGRWLAADALVMCRISRTNQNDVAMDLALVNPLTSTTIAGIHRTGPSKDRSELVRAAAKELVDRWRTGPDIQSTPDSPLSPATVDAGLAGLRPDFKSLAAALAKVRREPEKSENHQALADAFGATGRLRLAALEIERSIDTLDIRAPGADKTYFGVHRWLYWAGRPSASATLSMVDKRFIDRLIQPLLDTYPQSLAAGCLRYCLAVRAWLDGNWQESIDYAARARQTIKPTTAHPELELEIVAVTYFLEGASLRKLAKKSEASSMLRDGLDYVKKFKVREACLPYDPWIGTFFGVDSVEGGGGDPPGIKRRIELELEALGSERERPTALYFQSAAAELIAATNAPSRTKQEWLRCVEQIADMLDRAPSGDIEALKAIVTSANSGLTAAMNQDASDLELRPLVFLQRLIENKQANPSRYQGKVTDTNPKSPYRKVDIWRQGPTYGSFSLEGKLVLEAIFVLAQRASECPNDIAGTRHLAESLAEGLDAPLAAACFEAAGEWERALAKVEEAVRNPTPFPPTPYGGHPTREQIETMKLRQQKIRIITAMGKPEEAAAYAKTQARMPQPDAVAHLAATTDAADACIAVGRADEACGLFGEFVKKWELAGKMTQQSAAARLRWADVEIARNHKFEASELLRAVTSQSEGKNWGVYLKSGFANAYDAATTRLGRLRSSSKVNRQHSSTE